MHLPAREKLYASGVAIVLLAVISFAGMRAARPDAPLNVEQVEYKAPHLREPLSRPQPIVLQGPAEERIPRPEFNELIVQLAGAVYRPGLLHLPTNARLQDAINAASGAKPDADLAALNMAAKVVDGDSIYVPVRQDDPQATAIEEAKTLPHYRVSGASSPALTSAPGTVSINSADARTLETLPGVGPATAEKIIAFRQEHGGFHSVDELQMVPGITPSKYAKLLPYLQL